MGAMEWWNNGMLGQKKRSAAGGLLSVLPAVSKKRFHPFEPIIPWPRPIPQDAQFNY